MLALSQSVSRGHLPVVLALGVEPLEKRCGERSNLDESEGEHAGEGEEEEE